MLQQVVERLISDIKAWAPLLSSRANERITTKETTRYNTGYIARRKTPARYFILSDNWAIGQNGVVRHIIKWHDGPDFKVPIDKQELTVHRSIQMVTNLGELLDSELRDLHNLILQALLDE